MASVPRVALRPAFQALFLVLLLETLLGWAASALSAGRGWRMLILLGAFRVFQTLAAFGVFFRADGHLGALGLGPGTLRSGTVRGMVWSLGFGGAVLIGFVALFLAGIDPIRLFRIPSGATVPDRIALFAVGGLVGPFAEEVIFRGILYGALRRWGVAAALGASTAVFALLHGGGGFTQIAGGLLFGLAYEREGKLMAPVAVHALGNTALFALSLIG